jgi:hypothetical protein
MTNHPTKDWEFDDTIEEEFQKWFNDLCGGFSFRSEWLDDDCEVEDEKTRKDLMYKWVHSAFVVGYNMGRYEGLEVGLTNNED